MFLNCDLLVEGLTVASSIGLAESIVFVERVVDAIFPRRVVACFEAVTVVGAIFLAGITPGFTVLLICNDAVVNFFACPLVCLGIADVRKFEGNDVRLFIDCMDFVGDSMLDKSCEEGTMVVL